MVPILPEERLFRYTRTAGVLHRRAILPIVQRRTIRGQRTVHLSHALQQWSKRTVKVKGLTVNQVFHRTGQIRPAHSTRRHLHSSHFFTSSVNSVIHMQAAAQYKTLLCVSLREQGSQLNIPAGCSEGYPKAR